MGLSVRVESIGKETVLMFKKLVANIPPLDTIYRRKPNCRRVRQPHGERMKSEAAPRRRPAETSRLWVR